MPNRFSKSCAVMRYCCTCHMFKRHMSRTQPRWEVRSLSRSRCVSARRPEKQNTAVRVDLLHPKVTANVNTHRHILLFCNRL
jgi:hypothetical protein